MWGYSNWTFFSLGKEYSVWMMLLYSFAHWRWNHAQLSIMHQKDCSRTRPSPECRPLLLCTREDHWGIFHGDWKMQFLLIANQLFILAKIYVCIFWDATLIHLLSYQQRKQTSFRAKNAHIIIITFQHLIPKIIPKMHRFFRCINASVCAS